MRRVRSASATPEQLELRILPTVKVSFNEKKGLLKITGDKENNSIRFDGFSDGSFELDVGGQSQGLFDNIAAVKINLKGGDDGLFFQGTKIDGSVNVKLGRGADELDVDNSTINDEIFPSLFGGDFFVDFGGNTGDYADFDDTVTIQGNLTLNRVADVDFHGDGLDFSPESNDILIAGNFFVSLSGAGVSDSDGLEIHLDNVNVNGNASLLGSSATDRIRIIQSSFAGNFLIDLGDGNDTLDIENGLANGNKFGGQTELEGGNDEDTLALGNDNDFAVSPLVTGFETIA